MGDGDHLVQIHDHLRGELSQLRQLVEQVARGHLDAGAARDEIAAMTLRQNDWTLGTYCQTYCRMLTMHHTIEDRSMYPRLRAADPSLGPALDRMVTEHLEVHGRLDQLDRSLVALVSGAGPDDVRDALARLEETLLAHLTYEEEQLVEPLNRFGMGI